MPYLADQGYHVKDTQLSRFMKVAVIVIISACIVSIGARWVMIEKTPFIVDELVDMQLGVQMERGEKIYLKYNWLRTPLLTSIIAMTTPAGADSFNTAVHARKIMWFCMVAIFILTFITAFKFSGFQIALLSIVLLCGFTTFLDRSIRIRSDLISVMVSLPALMLLIRSRRRLLHMGLAGLCLGMAVLATQKASYFVIAFAVAIIGSETIVSGVNLNSAKRIARIGIASFIGFLLPLLAFLLWLQQTGQLTHFIDQAIFHAAKAGLADDTYEKMTRAYIRQTIYRNPAFWCLGVSGLFLLIHDGIKAMKGRAPLNVHRRKSYIGLGLWTFVTVALVLRHNVRFPYVFLNISPYMAICGSYATFRLLAWLWNAKSRRPLRIFLFAVVSFFLIVPPALHHFIYLKKHPKIDIQASILNRVDHITKPSDAVFDGIGMAVTRNKATPYSMTYRWKNERKTGAHNDIIESLIASKPPVMIYNYRMKHLTVREKKFLATHFVSDWGNIFVVGVSIVHEGNGPTKRTVNLLASAEYAVLAKNRKNILIDGTSPGEVEFLNAGDHEIVISGERQKFTLKYFPAVGHTLPPVKPYKLFPSYSE